MTESTETERMGVVGGESFFNGDSVSVFQEDKSCGDGWLYNTVNVLNTAKMDTTVTKIWDFSVLKTELNHCQEHRFGS